MTGVDCVDPVCLGVDCVDVIGGGRMGLAQFQTVVMSCLLHSGCKHVTTC